MNRPPSPSAAFWLRARRIVLGHSIALVLLAVWLLELRTSAVGGPSGLEVLIALPLAFTSGLLIDAASRWTFGGLLVAARNSASTSTI